MAFAEAMQLQLSVKHYTENWEGRSVSSLDNSDDTAASVAKLSF